MEPLTFYELHRAEEARRERRLAQDLMVRELRAERRRLAAERRETAALVRTTSLRRRARTLVRRLTHRAPSTPVRMA
ncbi:hypothetical protein [Xylanimonas protaetiae]|uniref:Uncharacterized protein n=1 Tax=Xylanimonas protaetiae TaxID=2509457 RepID=A0A4P6F735_9MICO|nr:hypothetical protein [Xylanimonas protaetiae]QAY71484.1 hypothetical protein ET471_16820 [Xylanimonas protaetiae]